MAAFYTFIGKRINDFLKPETYDLNRNVKIVTDSGDVSWSLDNQLLDDGRLDSELTVSYLKRPERFILTTGTKNNPQIKIVSDRLKQWSSQISVQDPELELSLQHQKPKYTAAITSKYDWSKHHCDAQLNGTYQYQNFLIGGMVKFSRDHTAEIKPQDYNVGVQFSRTADTIFAFNTENSTKEIKFGAQSGIREGYTGYGQIHWKRHENNKIGWSLGIERLINPTTILAGVYRSDNTASMLYRQRLLANNLDGSLALNANLKESPVNGLNLRWRLIFS